jgi:membrane protein YqaA with SNARE-associated domain
MTLLVVWLTTFGVCVAGSLVPLINCEIYLLGAVALAPPHFTWPLVFAAALGQTVGKVLMYFAGEGVLKLPIKRVQRGLEATQAKMEARPVWGKFLFFCSAVFSFPPLYVMALAAGAVRMNFIFFVVACGVGRFLHFAGVAVLPELWQRLSG